MRKLLLPIFVIALLPVTAVFSQTFSSFKSSGTYDQFVPVVFSTNNISMITLMRQDIHADRTWLAHGIVNITAIGFGWGSGGNGVRVDNFSNAVETDQNTGRKTGFVGRVVGDWSLNNVVVFLRGGTTYATNAAIVRNDGYFQDIAQMQSFSPVAFTDPAYGLPKGTFYADLDLNPVSAVFSAVSNGNVGIGLSNPQNKLDVKGKMHAQEVKVDMTGWSDYVLKKDYKRPSLEAVEKHIEQKGTLPGIPTEAAVIKDGIELGEMNKKLLGKIEELTLYLIEQNKAIKTLYQQNQSQQKEIDLLKTQIKK